MVVNNPGKKIKEFREFRQITRDDLALKANLDKAQMKKIEEMGVMPSLGPVSYTHLDVYKRQERHPALFRSGRMVG